MHDFRNLDWAGYLLKKANDDKKLIRVDYSRQEDHHDHFERGGENGHRDRDSNELVPDHADADMVRAARVHQSHTDCREFCT